MRLLFILCGLPALAAISGVTVSPTHNAAVMSYTAPTAAACTVEVSTAAGYAPLVHDVNSTLFSGAGTDGGGQVYRSLIVGKMTVETGLDGANYSRALQTATRHYYRITCAGDTATGSFETRNIPLGMTYVPNQQTAGSTGTWKQPTASYTDRTQEIIDPITGALLKRILLPRDGLDEYPPGVVPVSAGSGAAWTSPGSVAGDDATYASYSGTAQAKLAATISTTVRSSYVSLDFIHVTLDGYGSGATAELRTVQVCLSEDGATCVGTTNDLILPATAGTVVYNASATVGDLMGWPSPSIATIQAGTLRLLVWKKATSGADTIFLDNILVYWGQSKVGIPTSGGFHDICSIVASDGWTQCVINGQLYGIRTTDGLVRTLGTLTFLNASVAGLIASGGNNCETFGGGSRMWSATNANHIFCNAQLSGGGLTLVRLTTDSTNADKGQGTYDNWFTAASPLVLLPAGSDLGTLLLQFDSTLPSSFNCGFDAVQGNYVIGSCRAGQQDTYAYTFAFSLGDGTAVGSVGCGTISGGKCQTSGVGIVAVNKVFAKPICRWCTFHTLHSQGATPVMSFEVQRPTGSLAYGNNPGIVTLNGAINATQTTINVTSTWPTGAAARPGTISSDGVVVSGSGTTFPSETTIGDTITAGGQSRVVTAVLNNSGLIVSTAFSPNITTQTWTNTPPSAPAGYATGDPISTKFPRYLMDAEIGDYFQIGSEVVRITGKPSNTQWTVSRGCTYFEGSCSGTGSTALDAATVTAICNAFVLDGYALAYYWDFVADPTAADDNEGDATNAGNHAFAGIAPPNGFSGSHQTSRGKIRAMAGYDVQAVPEGMLNRQAWARPSNYSLFTAWYFGGKFSPNGGNTFQRHPSNQQSDSLSGYQYDFFTDVTPFVGGSGFVEAPAASTLVEGTLYRVGTPDPNINPEPRPTRKYLPTMMLCGYRPLTDISGPASHIVTSTTAYTYCYAEAAGECRGGGDAGGAATAGQHFVNCPIVNTAYCSAGENYTGLNDICIGNQAFDGNATVQWGVTIQPDEDTIATEGPKRARVLAKVFDQPRALPGTANAKVLPDGSWIMHPGVSNVGNEVFLLKNPGMPPLDSINRQTFVPVSVQIHAVAGADNAYVEFGYDANFYCTSRTEACVAAASNAPYFFARESFSGVSCSSGCTIDVPSLPSRVLRYRIVWRNATTVLRRSSTSSIAVP